MSKHDENKIDMDALEEAREVLMYAIESRSWLEAEDALGLISELLGYDPDEDEEDGVSKRNHLEE